MTPRRSQARKHARAPFSLAVHYRTQGSFLVSYSLNLSKGGLFLETQNLLPIGTSLTVRFGIPGKPDPVETEATVVWMRKNNTEGLPTGLGVQFDKLEDHIGDVIDDMASRFAGVKLMAIADDATVLERLERYLQSILACDVESKGSAAVQGNGFPEQIDLVLLDLDATGKAGQPLLDMARSQCTPPIPVIALSHSSTLRSAAQKSGSAAVLSNPPTYEQLRETVLQVLGKPYALDSRE